MADDVCVCGHPRADHEHYRAGTDCAICGVEACASFTPPSWWRRVLGRS